MAAPGFTPGKDCKPTPSITWGPTTLEDWKIYLRNLQHNASIHDMATLDSPSSESSFELDDDFKALLDRKRREKVKRSERRITRSMTRKQINSSPTMVNRNEGRIKLAKQAAGDERKLAHNMSAMTDDNKADLSEHSCDVSVRVRSMSF